MKRYYDKLWAKITAFVLLLLFTAVTVCGSIGMALLITENAYFDDGKQMQKHLYASICARELAYVCDYLDSSNYYISTDNDTPDWLGELSEYFPADSCNCAIVVTEAKTGKELARSFAPDSRYLYTDTVHGVSCSGVAVNVTAYLRPDYTPHHIEDAIGELLLAWRSGIIVLTAAAFVLFLFTLVFSLSAAGHWQGYEGIHLTWFDKLPMDLYLLGCCCLLPSLDGSWLDCVVFGSILGTLLLLLLVSFSARCKAHTVWRSSAVAWCLRRLWRFLRWLCGMVCQIPLVWKTAVGVAALLVLELLYLCNWCAEEFLIMLFLVHVLLGLFLLYLALGLRKLQKGGEALAQGQYDTPVDTRGLWGDFKRHGENLNAIQQGIQRAVASETRSERMKTELITNVSHDIKTPLTSIVNYVDLLKKEAIDNPTAQEYIAVLDRQSQRLRRLTEDLVEASKAASGNLPVELAPTDLGVLLEQVLGEYESRLQQSGITPVLTLPETPVVISADGRLLWRVLDNLLSNVCKYALSGTRVYLAAEQDSVADKVRITVKNISRCPLNISAEELTERFVRGDESRSTEGSGLGLSIASSLTALQSGRFALSVDGDLFKASLTFDSATEA